MKKSSFLLMALLLMGLQQTIANQPTNLKENDKEFLLNYYQENIESLRAKTANLSIEQLNFQTTDESWSILMCLEHIYRTELSLVEMVQEVLEQPGNDQAREDLVTTDEELLRNILDRSSRFKAPEVLHPTGEFANAEEILSSIIENRARIFELIESYSVEDMRNRVADAPFGKIDGYQYLLFIAGHAERHSLQIDEIMASDGFREY